MVKKDKSEPESKAIGHRQGGTYITRGALRDNDGKPVMGQPHEGAPGLPDRRGRHSSGKG